MNDNGKQRPTKYAKAVTCPVCKCVVMVSKHNKLKASLMRALALADHFKTLHAEAK